MFFETKSQCFLLTALKNLKFIEMSLDIFHGLGFYRIGLGSHGLGLAYIFGSFHYHLGKKII